MSGAPRAGRVSSERKYTGKVIDLDVDEVRFPDGTTGSLEMVRHPGASAVVPMLTETGPEPCAVLAFRGSGDNASAVVERANAKLAEFQRIHWWVLWPEPDLPRTSTGKVRRKPVAAWLARIQAAAGAAANGSPHRPDANKDAFGPSSDWLLALISQVSGETPRGVGDEQRLTEDLHLDSLGRVQLASAIEERLGIVQGNGLLEEVETLGDLRRLVAGGDIGTAEEREPGARGQVSGVRDQPGREQANEGTRQQEIVDIATPSVSAVTEPPPPKRRRYLYPTWPWWKPVGWIREAFIEAIMRPLVWFLAPPRVVGPARPLPDEPMIIVSNHVVSYDGPFVEFALPGPVRRRMAVAMSGDMLEDFRNWRNGQRPNDPRFFLWGPGAYFLVTMFFNVFPLPRQRDFQASFAHAGKALDHGYNVLVFPEGALSPEGKMARFRPGIGLLVKQSYAPVLPMAIRGLGELKTGQRRWFRSRTIEVHIGEPIRFGPEATEAAITARLEQEVEKLLNSQSS